MALDRAPNSPQANQPAVMQGGLPTRQANTVLEEMWRQIVAGFVIVPCTAAGTNAITLTPRLHKEGAANYGDHMAFAFVAANSSTGAVTALLQPASGSSGALPAVKVYKNGGATQAGAGDVVSGSLYLILYEAALDSGNGGFVIVGGGAAFGVGAWTAYTPTVASGTGTLTTVAAVGQYLQVGKVVFIQIRAIIITNGTGATFIQASLPITPTSEPFTIAGREPLVSGKMLQGFINGAANVAIYNYDGTYPGADGASINVSGIYEAA